MCTVYMTCCFQIAGVNYGGHVTDDWDRRVLLTYIGDVFRDEAVEIPYHKWDNDYVYIIIQKASIFWGD